MPKVYFPLISHMLPLNENYKVFPFNHPFFYLQCTLGAGTEDVFLELILSKNELLVDPCPQSSMSEVTLNYIPLFGSVP